jgi:hypothetical protein
VTFSSSTNGGAVCLDTVGSNQAAVSSATGTGTWGGTNGTISYVSNVGAFTPVIGDLVLSVMAGETCGTFGYAFPPSATNSYTNVNGGGGSGVCSYLGATTSFETFGMAAWNASATSTSPNMGYGIFSNTAIRGCNHSGCVHSPPTSAWSEVAVDTGAKVVVSKSVGETNSLTISDVLSQLRPNETNGLGALAQLAQKLLSESNGAASHPALAQRDSLPQDCLGVQITVDSVPTLNTGPQCGAKVPSSVGGQGFITNLDCGNCMVADGKFYNFVANVSDSAAAPGVNIDQVRFKFDDGIHTIVFGYDNGTKSTLIYQGGDYVSIGQAAPLNSRIGNSVFMKVVIPVALRPTILDAANRTVSLFVNATDGSFKGYNIVLTGLTLLNQGGATTSIVTGNASKISGGGQFACVVSLAGSCDTNSTWWGLQHYQTQFAIQLGGAPKCNPTQECKVFGDTALWQDKGHAGLPLGTEFYTAAGDWQVTIHWYYWDGIKWVDGQHLTIKLLYGNQGISDEWTQLQTAWYSGNTLVRNDSINAWIEQEPVVGAVSGQVRLFVDMWFGRDNASTVHGGHVAAYYNGVNKQGYLWWGSWSPIFANESSSISLAPNLNSTGGIVSAQLLPCSKIGFDVTRQQTQPNAYYIDTIDRNFSISAADFQIEKFVTTPNIAVAGGVAVPNFAVTQVPNLPSSGFLTPLFSLLSGIASAIWGVLSQGLAAIWAGLGSQFPWFTGFFDSVYAGITGFFGLFPGVVNAIAGFLGFLGPLFSLLTIPFQIIGNAWNLIVVTYNAAFKGVDIGQLVELFLLLVFGLSIMGAVLTGDWPFIINMARQAWRIAEAILWWTYEFIRVVIDNIIGLIP